MIKMEFIGNLTKDPEKRSTTGGITVCNFTVAVNRKVNGEDKPVFIRVSAWRELGENCFQYLRKGRKVYVSGFPEARGFTTNAGETAASLQCAANVVEFLSPKAGDADDSNIPGPQEMDAESGMQKVESDDLPF